MNTKFNIGETVYVIRKNEFRYVVLKSAKIDKKIIGFNGKDLRTVTYGFSDGDYAEEQFVFLTKKKADLRCKILNGESKTVKLDSISICKDFFNSIPATAKLCDRINEYRSGEEMPEIILNQNNCLIDGYTTYLVLKMFGEEKTLVTKFRKAIEYDY